MRPQGFDQEKVSFNLARLKKGGETFEIVIDPEKITDYLNKKIHDVSEILLAEKIFSDAKRGFEASHEHMEALFNTTDVGVIAKKILKEGEIQLTQEYRDQKKQEKLNRVLDIITRNAIDPRSGLPHPRVRIEAAFDEAKLKIDPLKEAEDQVNEILSKLKPILPIKFALKEISVVIPANYTGKAYSVIDSYGKKIQDTWQNDGSWNVIVEIPAGLQNDFFDAVNRLTQGSAETKILREK